MNHLTIVCHSLVMGQSIEWLKLAHAVTCLLSVVDLLHRKTLSLINLITYKKRDILIQRTAFPVFYFTISWIVLHNESNCDI